MSNEWREYTLKIVRIDDGYTFAWHIDGVPDVTGVLGHCNSAEAVYMAAQRLIHRLIHPDAYPPRSGDGKLDLAKLHRKLLTQIKATFLEINTGGVRYEAR